MSQKDNKLMKNERDLKRRKSVVKNEKKRRALELIFHNLQLPDYVRAHAFQKLQKLPRDSSASRLTNRCVETGRPKSVMRNFKLSRIKLRDFATDGLLPGLRKASW